MWILSRASHHAGRRRVAGFVAVGCALWLLVGCSPNSEDKELIDLIGDWIPVELQWEEAVVDFGTSSARRHLASGWNPPSDKHRQTFVWSRGDTSEFEFDLVAARDVELVLNCRALPARGLPPQEIVLSINDDEVGRVAPGQNFGSHGVRLSKESLRVGRNTVVLRYAWARSPKSLGDGIDWRRLAIAVKEVQIRGAAASSSPHFDSDKGTLTMPAGSAAHWALQVHSGATLQGQVVGDENGDATVVVSLVEETGHHREIGRWRAGDHANVRIPNEIQGPVRLILRHLPGDYSNESVVVQGLALRNPKSNSVSAELPLRSEPLFSQAAAGDRLNVVVYLVDALRADHLGVYGYWRDVSPRVDAFAKESLVFDQAWANSSWTRPAVASILTGLRPEVHLTNRRDDRLPAGIDTLPEILRTNGYRTAAVVANPNVSGVFGFDQGFEEFTVLPTATRRSSDVHEEACRLISGYRDRVKPFFLYLHTVDPHLPYDPPDQQRQRFAAGVGRRDLGSTENVGTLQARRLVDEESYVDDLIDLYDAEIASNDQQFGRLLDHLEDLGLSDETIVVFLADHGEEFFDHGGWIHGTSLYSEVLRIPLIVRIPGRENTGRTAVPVQQADLTPSILGLLGLSVPDDLQGRNLTNETSSRMPLGAFLDLDSAFGRSVVDEHWHAIQHGSYGYMGQAEIYNVASDPTEKEQGLPEFAPRPSLMLGNDRNLMRSIEGRFETSDAEVDAETRKQLEALGYL